MYTVVKGIPHQDSQTDGLHSAYVPLEYLKQHQDCEEDTNDGQRNGNQDAPVAKQQYECHQTHSNGQCNPRGCTIDGHYLQVQDHPVTAGVEGVRKDGGRVPVLLGRFAQHLYFVLDESVPLVVLLFIVYVEPVWIGGLHSK